MPECFFGRLKGTFRILGDEDCRLDPCRIESVVTPCIALTDQNTIRRGHLSSKAMAGGRGFVPLPYPSGLVPCGARVKLARLPPVDDDDLLSGLNPNNAATI